jgi:Protein of unknown function (DUF2934)
MDTKKARSSKKTAATTNNGATARRGTAAKTTATSRSATPRRASTSSSTPATTGTTAAGAVSLVERQQMISVAAYLRAERRGFSGGTPEDDWFAAEAEVEAMLERSVTSGSARRAN